jgi:hypothetical protein
VDIALLLGAPFPRSQRTLHTLIEKQFIRPRLISDLICRISSRRATNWSYFENTWIIGGPRPRGLSLGRDRETLETAAQ